MVWLYPGSGIRGQWPGLNRGQGSMARSWQGRGAAARPRWALQDQDPAEEVPATLGTPATPPGAEGLLRRAEGTERGRNEMGEVRKEPLKAEQNLGPLQLPWQEPSVGSNPSQVTPVTPGTSQIWEEKRSTPVPHHPAQPWEEITKDLENFYLCTNVTPQPSPHSPSHDSLTFLAL